MVMIEDRLAEPVQSERAKARLAAWLKTEQTDKNRNETVAEKGK